MSSHDFNHTAQCLIVIAPYESFSPHPNPSPQRGEGLLDPAIKSRDDDFLVKTLIIISVLCVHLRIAFGFVDLAIESRDDVLWPLSLGPWPYPRGPAL
jgi:hypothetical protein